MSLLRRLSSESLIPRLRQSKRLSYLEKYYTLDRIGKSVVVVGGLVALAIGGGLLYFAWEESKMKHKVRRQFKEGCSPKGLREDDYIRRDVQDEITTAFCDKTDTDGMFGIVFGAAGTGKSNVLRHICKERHNQSKSSRKFSRMFSRKSSRKTSGVLYVELGSDARFAHKIADTCGIPLEPSIFEVAITKIFPSWKRHLTLPLDDEITALAQVFSVIEEGGLQYKENEGNGVPVLIIDGADIVAKNNPKLFDGLLEWAKKCANEDTVLIVMGSSDGHVLRYVTKQACKSRAAPFIEVTDFPKFDDLKQLFDAHKVPRDIAECLFNEITGGRLTDIYKAIRLYNKLVAVKPPTLKKEEILEKIKDAFESEMKQALNKAMDDPSNVLQLEIAAAVIDRNLRHGVKHPLSVHELALELVQHGVVASVGAVMDAAESFVDNNILRYNVNQELVAHSKMAGNVLEDLVTSSGIQQRRCWQQACYKRWWYWLRGNEHHSKCRLAGV